MTSQDLRGILSGWDYVPDKITVRRIVGDDGATKIQMRLPLGLLQMEISGRPDGLQPHGFESLLEYYQHRQEEHITKNGTELELTSEDCRALHNEWVMYYHRFLAEFVLEEFDAVDRDTARNLRVLDLCRKAAREESDRLNLEQYRPYLVMMNTRAQAHSILRSGALEKALARVNAGLATIHETLGPAKGENSTELGNLESLRDEILARLPANRT